MKRKRGRFRTRDSSPVMAITRGNLRMSTLWPLVATAVLAATLVLVLASPDSHPDEQDPGGDSPGRVYQDVGIPGSNLSTVASWYTYGSGATQVRFFTVVGSDGVARAALDACDVCYTKKLGFHQQGDRMTCNSCGKTFSVDGIGSQNLPDTCWPGFVPSKVSEDFLLIDTNFLDGKAFMFE